MPEPTLSNILFFVCVGLFTLAAAVWDFRTRRIPNALTLPVFVLGLIYQVSFFGWSGGVDGGIAASGLKSALLGFLMGFGTLFVLWIIGGGGGGDVKLMGALSVWLGFQLTLYVMICSTVFVLVGTLLAMFWSLIARGSSTTFKRYLTTRKPSSSTGKRKPAPETVAERQKRRVMAYAVPVAMATWAVIIWKLPQM